MQFNCSYTELVNISKLIPNPKNANKHPPKQIERLAKIIDFQGQRSPIVVSKRSGFITKGHGRLEAIKLLGWTDAAVDYQDYLSEAQEYADIIADNEIARWASLDREMLTKDLLEIDLEDIELLGLEDFKLVEAEVIPSLTDEDEIPEVKESIVKRGDIWLLGNHRLMCGDSTIIDDFDKLMKGEKANMVFTSPPYNCKDKRLYAEFEDNRDSEEYVTFCSDILEILFMNTEGFIFWNIMYNAQSRYEYIQTILPRIENLHETIVWKKRGMPLSAGLTRNFEFIFCFKNGDKKNLGEPFVTESNFWEISNSNSQNKGVHMACFPVELPEKGILLASKEGDIVLEPFGGAGTTIIASEKNKRRCFSMELSEKYCDVIIKRWENYTGKKATRLEE